MNVTSRSKSPVISDKLEFTQITLVLFVSLFAKSLLAPSGAPMVTLVYYIPVCHEGHKGHKAMKVISLCLLGSLFFPTMPRRRRGRITTTSQATTRTVKAIMLIWAESLTLGNGCAGYKNKILKSIHTYYEVVN